MRYPAEERPPGATSKSLPPHRGLFRERGFEGVSVAELMAAAG